MSDPDIARVRANCNLIAAVQAVWEQYPSWRFGQLVMNLSREPGGFADTWEWSHAEWYERIQELADGDLSSQPCQECEALRRVVKNESAAKWSARKGRQEAESECEALREKLAAAEALVARSLNWEEHDKALTDRAETAEARVREAELELDAVQLIAEQTRNAHEAAEARLREAERERDEAQESNAVFMSGEAYSRLHDAWHTEQDRAETAERQLAEAREALALLMEEDVRVNGCVCKPGKPCYLHGVTIPQALAATERNA